MLGIFDSISIFSDQELYVLLRGAIYLWASVELAINSYLFFKSSNGNKVLRMWSYLTGVLSILFGALATSTVIRLTSGFNGLVPTLLMFSSVILIVLSRKMRHEMLD